MHKQFNDKEDMKLTMKLITDHLSACEMGINFYCIRCFNINHYKRLALKKLAIELAYDIDQWILKQLNTEV